MKPASPDDVAAIASIHARSWAATYPTIPPPPATEERDVWMRRVVEPQPGNGTLVASLDGRTAGFVYFGPATDASTTGLIHSLHVDPDLVRRGIGRRLVDAALDGFQHAGYTAATLWVVDSNQRARRFYERGGWKTDGSRRREPLALDGRDGTDVDVVRYTRSLGMPDRAAPKYYELRQWLRRHVDGLPPGTPLAPERALSEQFNVSRTTVRQALHDLAVEGRIVRQQGRGTFVAPPKVTQHLRLTSYTHEMLEQGRRPSSRLIDVAVIAADHDVAEHLELPERSPALRVERVRYADDEPMAVETVYLDHARFPELGGQLDASSSLYTLLDTAYGVVPVAADETIETVLAPPSASRLLGTDSRTPMLLLTRRSRDQDGKPVEYVRSLYRGDRYRFSTRISRPLPG